MGLRFDPVGGGQFKQLVNQLIEAERQPIKNLEARRQKEQVKLKLFQEFKGKVGGLRNEVEQIADFTKLRSLKVDLGDGAGAIAVTVDESKAKPGSYQIEIDELAQRSSMITNGLSSPEETSLGMGFVVVKTPDETFEIFVDEKDASLKGIAKAINERRESPVVAEVIQDVYDPDQKWKLIVKAKKDGAENEAVFSELYFLGGTQDIWIDDDRQAENAIIFIDGYEIETAGNEVPNFLEGVNIHLKEARPGKPFTINISMDYEKVSGKVRGVVDKMNDVLNFINLQNKVDESSDTSTTFTGDTGLQSIEYRLRNLLHEGFPVWDQSKENYRLVHLNRLGLEFNREGTVSFDDKKFQQALEEDFDGVSEAISGEFGLAFQLGEVLKIFTRPYDGLLNQREQGLQQRIKSIDRDIENAERRVDRKAQNLTDRFARLQSTLGNLQSQQQYVSANLGGGGGLVSQLLG